MAARKKAAKKKASKKKATRRKVGDYFSTHPAALARLEDYLAYGYLEINEYLRDPKAYAKERTAKETAATRKAAAALVRDLRAAQGKSVSVCRAQLLSGEQTVKALADRRLKSTQPMFVSKSPTICNRVAEGLEPGPGEHVVDLKLNVPTVDVSGYGRKRPGEQLVPPTTLEVEKTSTRKGRVNMRATTKKKASRK